MSADRLVGASLLLLGALAAAPDLPAQDREVERWRVSPEPILEIGRMSGPEAYLFQSIGAARFLPDGRIVVADDGQGAVRVYGSDGRFLHAIGGRGEGPGEFRSVQGMWITPEGNVGVWDDALNRISTFAPDGELEGSGQVQAEGNVPGGNLEVHVGTYSDGDVGLATLTGTVTGGSNRVPVSWVLARFAPDGTFQGRLGELRGMRRTRGQPLPLTPVPFVAVHGDSIYASDGYEAEITVLDGSGEEAGTIKFPAAELSSEEAWSTLEEALTARGEAGLLERLEALPRDRVPRVGGLRVDDGGRLWVKEYDPSTDALYLKEGSALNPTTGGVWRVIRPDGELVARIPMPEDVAPLEIRGDRILGLSRDELDVERVVVHELRR